MLVYMTYAIAFNIVFGHTKQLFLCMGALAGCSAYLSLVLTRDLGLPPGVTMPLGVLFASSLGAFFSYASVRRGLGVIFVGVITIAFSLVFQNLILGTKEPFPFQSTTRTHRISATARTSSYSDLLPPC